MNVSYTPDGIPVIELNCIDMEGPAPAGFTAAVDQVTAAARARGADFPPFDVDAYDPHSLRTPASVDEFLDRADDWREP